MSISLFFSSIPFSLDTEEEEKEEADENDAQAQDLRELRVLELGAGCGLPGIVAACRGANVTLTDLEEVVPWMEARVQQAASHVAGRCSVKALLWGGCAPSCRETAFFGSHTTRPEVSTLAKKK